MNPDSVRKIGQTILKQAGNRPVQIFIRTKKGILARFANNGVHQNNFQDLFSYVLRALTPKGPVYVESNDPSEKGTQAAWKKLMTLAPHPLPIPESKETCPKIKESFPLRIEEAPDLTIRAIGESLRRIRRLPASANGYCSAYERMFYLVDTNGLERFHPATAVRFGVTITKGSGKGYFSFYHPDPRRLSVDPVMDEAIELAESASHSEVTLEPGEYECIFSPRAFLELMEPLRRHFDRRLTEDRKSVFSGLVGKKVFSKTFTLCDDVRHSGQFGLPFDAEGNPRKKAVLVKEGVLTDLLGEGSSTRGFLEHPFYPQNLVVQKGDLSLQEIFKSVRKGVFINKIWYHTLVRESAMEVTGLATGGSLYIERGRIRGRAVRLRYHDSLFSILRSVAGATREQILLKDGEMGAALFPYLWVSRLRLV